MRYASVGVSSPSFAMSMSIEPEEKGVFGYGTRDRGGVFPGVGGFEQIDSGDYGSYAEGLYPGENERE